MKPVTLYARFSPRPTEGGETKCESIATQLERLRDYCRALGLTIEAEESDEEASGRSMNGRPGLQRAIARVCKSKGVLMVYSLSRLARNTRDAIAIAETLDSHGADLSSLHERIDTTTPTGRFFFTVLAALAQLEREQTAERTSEAMISHQARGRRMGRSDRVPYGWHTVDSDPEKIEPDSFEQGVIARIKRLNTQGMPNRAICRTLDNLAIPRRSGTWAGQHGLVASILKRNGNGQSES